MILISKNSGWPSWHLSGLVTKPDEGAGQIRCEMGKCPVRTQRFQQCRLAGRWSTPVESYSAPRTSALVKILHEQAEYADPSDYHIGEPESFKDMGRLKSTKHAYE